MAVNQAKPSKKRPSPHNREKADEKMIR